MYAVPGLGEDVQLVKNEMLKAPRGQRDSGLKLGLALTDGAQRLGPPLLHPTGLLMQGRVCTSVYLRTISPSGEANSILCTCVFHLQPKRLKKAAFQLFVLCFDFSPFSMPLSLWECAFVGTRNTF